MLKLVYSTKFKKDWKRIKKRGYNLELLDEVIKLLIEQKPLPEIYKDHYLIGNYKRI